MKSTITVEVNLDEQKVPDEIKWTATDSTADMMQKAQATMLSFWDAQDKSALRIDLWTKDMMVDEMVDFYYQTFVGMADSFERSTHLHPLVADIKTFAKAFQAKFKELELNKNK